MFGWHLSPAKLLGPPHPGLGAPERLEGRRHEVERKGMGEPIVELGKLIRISPWVPMSWSSGGPSRLSEEPHLFQGTPCLSLGQVWVQYQKERGWAGGFPKAWSKVLMGERGLRWHSQPRKQHGPAQGACGAGWLLCV